jgi:hypothetical protein
MQDLETTSASSSFPDMKIFELSFLCIFTNEDKIQLLILGNVNAVRSN